jgi:hypothetical protein
MNSPPSRWETLTQALAQRIPPLVETLRISKCGGNSGVCSLLGKARIEVLQEISRR